MRTKFLLGLICICSWSLFGQHISPNVQIVDFCKQHLGQQVGDGECFALASHAFRAAGLTRPSEQTPNHGDFVWGKLVLYLQGNGSESAAEGTMANIMPGDVIQFRDAVFKKKKHSEHFKHHTAVVEEVANGGNDMKLLQQNYAGKKFVTELELHLPDMKSGWIRVYQPESPAK